MSSRRLALIFGTTYPAPQAAEPFIAPDIASASNPQAPLLGSLLLHLRSDEDLAAALSQGNAEALTVLFKRHSPLIFGIARRILRLDGEAEDCVQQVFLDVFRSVHQFDRNKGPFKTWLLMFAYHRTLNRRRALTAARVFDSQPLDDLLSSFAHTGTQIVDHLLLKQALASLQPRQRLTIELTYYEGLTAEEVAARTGETVRVVRHNLYRGLERLRRHLCPPQPSSSTRKGDAQ